jgi:hypothetical protein
MHRGKTGKIGGFWYAGGMRIPAIDLTVSFVTIGLGADEEIFGSSIPDPLV